MNGKGRAVKRTVLLLATVSFEAAAAPRIETLAVNPNPAAFTDGKPPAVEVVVGVSRTSTGSRNCDVAIDPGDGSRVRQLDFGVATTRSLRHTYKKAGNYQVVARGAGKMPCEGSKQTALTVTGPAEKKAPAKKETKKRPAKREKAPEGG